MTGLLDGTTIPWHIVSGKRDPAQPTTLPDTVRREPQTGRRIVAGGIFIASALAEQMRRFK